MPTSISTYIHTTIIAVHKTTRNVRVIDLSSASNPLFLFLLYYSIRVDLSGVIDTSLTRNTRSNENSTSILECSLKVFLGKTYVNLYTFNGLVV